jgi:hypothetical protein
MRAQDDKEMVHVRLPRSLVKRIDHMAVDADLYRAGAIERILVWAVERLDTEQHGEIPELQTA